MGSFVFLEITDKAINSLFFGMAEVVGGMRPSKATHLTLRGPYRHGVPAEAIKKCSEALKYDVVSIEGVGQFSNPTEEVVYLRVNSTNLRRVWWKPDYPIEKFGFNPHISIYRGKDRLLAEAIRKFFEHERMKVLCHQFRIVPLVTKQVELFALDIPLSKFPFENIILGNIQPNLLDRLGVVVQRHRRRGLENGGRQP